LSYLATGDESFSMTAYHLILATMETFNHEGEWLHGLGEAVRLRFENEITENVVERILFCLLLLVKKSHDDYHGFIEPAFSRAVEWMKTSNYLVLGADQSYATKLWRYCKPDPLASLFDVFTNFAERFPGIILPVISDILDQFPDEQLLILLNAG
jgi:hypothetical protein